MTATPIEFALSQEEANVAASRFAWRASLAEGLLARHLAPLAAFALVITFAAILGLTGLVGRRSAEIALLASAAAYMAYRLWSRRRFLKARRSADVWAESVRAAAPCRLSVDAQGLRLEATSLSRQWRWADGLEVEEVSGLVYVWPAQGDPLVWPLRVDGAGALAALARGRAGAGQRSSTAAVDDDD
jgi:hypothetical protein